MPRNRSQTGGRGRSACKPEPSRRSRNQEEIYDGRGRRLARNGYTLRAHRAAGPAWHRAIERSWAHDADLGLLASCIRYQPSWEHPRPLWCAGRTGDSLGQWPGVVCFHGCPGWRTRTRQPRGRPQSEVAGKGLRDYVSGVLSRLCAGRSWSSVLNASRHPMQRWPRTEDHERVSGHSSMSDGFLEEPIGGYMAPMAT